MRLFSYIQLFIVGCGVFFLEGCQTSYYRFTEGKIYGTTYHISYESDKNMDIQLKQEMEKVNSSLSMFDTTSILAKINRNEEAYPDSLFMKVYRTAREVYQITGGAFDITVAPLVNAWGFGYKNDRLPSEKKIDTLLLYTGMEKLDIREGKIWKADKRVEVDAGAIAKGLGVDAVADFLEINGCINYMVEIGGEVRAKGVSDKHRKWRIGIDNPQNTLQNRELQLIVELSDGALATSGNYRNYYSHEGEKYGHTIDPRTGYPVQREILSATVYTSSCMLADAFATSFMVLGLEESKIIVDGRPDLEACFIYEEEQEMKLWMTEGFSDLLLD